jgi:uncharacterized membrane protein YagU involved in acid resistance
MKKILIVIAIITFGLGLRSTKSKWLRKLGVLIYITSTGLVGFFVFDSIVLGIISSLAWFLLPWIELIFSVRKTYFPIENKLRRQSLPCADYFPEASGIKDNLESKGYKHITDCGWRWATSHEHYSFFWNEQDRHLVAICHRIQSCVTFCYVSVSSTTQDGRIWRSTNFPFSTSLPHSPSTSFNHITHGNISCPDFVLYSHELFLYEAGIGKEDLVEKDIDCVEQMFEQEMKKQIDHNLNSGLIQLTGDGHFRYSIKGLFYLWKQILKDMFRLC